MSEHTFNSNDRMILKDLLSYRPVNIEYRIVDPVDNEDMLFGYCHWTGSELIPEDGDLYYLDDEIIKHEWTGLNKLTVWIEGGWISG